MSRIKIKLKGVEQVYNQLKRAEEQRWPTIIRVIEKYVDLMVAEAKKNAPVDIGTTKASIGKQMLTHSVIFYLDSDHGAVQEFGTGARMDIPVELESEAIKFKGMKGGDINEFAKELEAWGSRKGIVVKDPYLMALAILRNGLRPQPFMYPAYLKYKDKIVPEIDKALTNLYKIK